MTVCSRASGSITARQFSKLPAIPWTRSSTGPLPASAYTTGRPCTLTVLASIASGP